MLRRNGGTPLRPPRSPLLKVGADVKTGRIPGIFGKTYILPVDPEVEEGIHSVKLHVHFPAVPVRRHFKSAAIGTYGVPFLVGRIILVGRLLHYIRPGAFKWIRLIGINGGAVTLSLPGGRHLNLLPVLYVVIRLVKIGRAALGILRPVELPLTVQGPAPFTVFRQHFQGGLQIAERREKGGRSFLIQMQVLFLFPFQPCGAGAGAESPGAPRPHMAELTASAVQDKSQDLVVLMKSICVGVDMHKRIVLLHTNPQF